jgi:hypothetical protein
MLNPRVACLATAAAGLLIICPAQYAGAQGGSRGGSSGATGSGTAAPSAGSRSTGSPTQSAPAAQPTTPGSSGPSAVGTPAPQVPPAAPLSSPPKSDFLGGSGGTNATTSGGGTPGPDGPASTSPSSSAPSRPGGGGEGVEACMGFWDAKTHMSKQQWAAACRRIANRLESLKSELSTPAQKSQPGIGSKRAHASRSRVSGAKNDVTRQGQ